jgi:hypothetical protein
MAGERLLRLVQVIVRVVDRESDAMHRETSRGYNFTLFCGGPVVHQPFAQPFAMPRHYRWQTMEPVAGRIIFQIYNL